MNDVKIGSNKSFGIVFFVVLLIVAIYPLFFEGNFRVWSFIVSLVFLILGLTNSKFLTPLKILWFKFGLLLGKIVSPIILGIVFFLVVTPTGLIMRAFKKDLLNLKKKDSKSYWIKRDKFESDMRNQF